MLTLKLQNVKSKIAFATDTWTNKQMIYSFACSIASFIDDEWKLIERVVDFCPLESKEHEGIHAARAFIESARKVGGFKKMSIHLCLDLANNLPGFPLPFSLGDG
jgi:hypothetical protein